MLNGMHTLVNPIKLPPRQPTKPPTIRVFSVAAKLLPLVTILLTSTQAYVYKSPEDSRVYIGITTDITINGIATTPSGRLFILFAHVDGCQGPQVAKWNRTIDSSTAYPNEE